MDCIHKAVGKSAKYVFISAGCVWVLHSSCWEPFFWLAGAVANTLLSKLLKHVVRSPRPPLSPKRGHGMPSSHAQSMCYFLCMLCIKQSRLTVSSSATPLLLSGIATYVFLASFWRVRSHLHTVAQTLTGAVLGVSFSLVWLYLERFVLSIEQYCIGFPGQHFMLCNHQLEYLLLEQVRLEYNHGRGPPLQLKLATLCCAIGAIYIYKRGVYPVSHTEHGVGISTPPVRSPGADRVPSSARRVHTSVTSLS